MPVFAPVTPPVVTPATLSCLASFRAATTPRSCTVTLYWWQTGGAASAIRASDTSPAITDSTSAWLSTGMTVTAPADAASVSIGVNVAGCGASEVHYVDEIGIFPGIVTQWSAGGFVGNTTTSIQSSDDGGVTWLPVRGGQNVVVPSTTQQVTVTDYESIPGVERDYQATVQTAVAPILASQPSAIAEATIATTDWWLLDPLEVSTAMIVHVLSLTTTTMRQAASHFTLGQKYPSIVSDITNGRDGAIQIECFTASEFSPLVALIDEGTVVFLTDPFGEAYYMIIGPAPGGTSSGAGLKLHDTALLTSTPANAHRVINATWNEQPRP